jgi:hypothetical protein
MGAIINIVIGIGLIIAGFSGLVLRGTNSGPLLSLLGVAILAFGVFQLWRRSSR